MICSRWSSMEEAEPEAEAPVAPQPKRPKRAQVLKSVLVASGKVGTMVLHLCWIQLWSQASSV